MNANDATVDWALAHPENWAGTNGGNVISMSRDPDLDQIEIEDIARALSNICRFNGQIMRHYSVAQHSLHVMEMVPDECKFAALMHDAPEAYTGDITTPLKRELGIVFRNIEMRITAAVGRRFNVNLIDLPQCVKEADRIMCVSERDQLQLVPGDWGPSYDGVLRYPMEIPYRDPHVVYQQFLEAFEKYKR